MYTVRPILTHELHKFAAISTPVQRQSSVLAYLEQMFEKGAMRPEWCFILEEEGIGIGRVAFWTLPGIDSPSDIVLLDLPWDAENSTQLAELLWQHLLLTCQEKGVAQLCHVLDSPVIAPQWQDNHEKRKIVLSKLGFQLQRETSRFEWTPEHASPLSAPALDAGITYRSLTQVGDAAIVDAIMRGSAFTLDRQIAKEREEHGPIAQARGIYQDLQSMSYDPDWWELAYAPDGQVIGFILPAKSPTFATIGYIGVLPEYRGRGYVDQLLNRGISTLLAAGETVIRADTDLGNHPMAKSFLRAGFHLFAQRSEYRTSLLR